MKKIFKIVCLFLIINCYFSCTTPAPLPGLVGEYEYLIESSGKLTTVQIISTSTGLSWYSPGLEVQFMTLISDVEFNVPPFESFGFVNTIEGELQSNELHVTQNIFDLMDLDTPVTISNRIYIRTK